MLTIPYMSLFTLLSLLIPLLSALRTITPNIHQKLPFRPIYITPNETQQYHLNHFFSGYNLKYSLSSNASCLSSLEIFQSLRLLNNWTTTQNSKDFTWSFFKDLSNLKRRIVGLDRSSNSLYTANLDIGSNLTIFSLFKNLGYDNSSCIKFTTFKNHSLISVLCIDPNGLEFLLMGNLSNNQQPMSAFYLDNKTNSTVKFILNDNNTFYLIRFWRYEFSKINSDHMEVYKFNLTANNLTLVGIINNETLNISVLTIIDLRVHNEEIFFSSINKIVVRFKYFSNRTTVVFSVRNSEILMMKIIIFESLGLTSTNLYILLENPFYIIILDWTDPVNPILLEKYAIRTNDNIMYVNFNQDYMVYYAARENSSNYLVIYERGKKLLNQIYLTLNFTKNCITIIEFIPENGNLVIFSEFTLQNFLLYEPTLRISANNLTTPELIPDSCTVSLIINSSDPEISTIVTTNVSLIIQMLSINDTKLYSIIDDSNSHSYIDYPGQNQFPLDKFYIGPNIYYNISWLYNNNHLFQQNLLEKKQRNKQKFPEDRSNQINFLEKKTTDPSFLIYSNRKFFKDVTIENPLFRVNKINKLDFDLSFLQIDPTTIIFQNMLSNPINKTLFIWFIQISNYTLFVIECASDNIEKPPICGHIGAIYEIASPIANLSLAYKEQTLWFAIKLDENLFKISFYDYVDLHLQNITLPIDNAVVINEISDFTILDFKIVLVLSLSQMLLIIDLNYPDKIIFTIDSQLMKYHLFDFFLPISVQSQIFHKNILFILDKISVIIVDISNIYENEIVIIKSIQSAATKKLGNELYYLSITKNTLVILSGKPQVIEEYSLSNYYLIYMRKQYPFYNYTIILKEDSFDSNDFSGVFFIHAVDQDKNAVILVLNSETIAHNVLYSIIPLNTKFPQIYLQTTGVNTVYLAIINNTNILFYQIYQNSTLILNSLDLTVSKINNTEIITFNVSISNSFQPISYNITYNLTTWDSGVNITLNNLNFLDNLIKLEKNMNKEIDICPNSLFNGSIISYSISCENDCGKNTSSIHLKSPLSFSRTILPMLPTNDYNDMSIDQEQDVILVQTSKILMVYDKEFNFAYQVEIPNTNCTKTAYSSLMNLKVFACKITNQNYVLYLSDSSNKIVSNIIIPIDDIAEMRFVKEYLMVLNAPEEGNDPTLFESSIFIFNFTSDKKFVVMDLIDSDDVGLDHFYISGMDIAESYYNDTIRFFLMDPYNGLRVVDFNTSDVDQHIQYSLNLLPYIEKDGVDQTVVFSSVKVVETQKSLKSQEFCNYSLILSTMNFHTYEIFLQINETSNTLLVKIVRCYLRYGFYSALNKIITSSKNSWFFIIPYILSNDLMINYNQFSKQIFIMYNRKSLNESSQPFIRSTLKEQLQNKTYDYSRLFGGYVLDSHSINYFATILEKPSVNDTLYTMIYKNPIDKTIEELLIRPNITLVFDQAWSNDSYLNLTAQNDYANITVRIKINEESNTDEDLTKMWIIGLVIALMVVAVILIFVVKKYGKKNDENDEELLEDDDDN